MLNRFAELRLIWRMVRTFLLVVGVLLSFFAVLELVRAYNILYQAHPWAGYGFAILIGLAVLLVVVYVTGTLARWPAVLTPPTGKVAHASRHWLRRYCRYLARYLGRLAENENLTDEQREQAAAAAGRIQRAATPAASADDLRKAIDAVEEETICPLLAVLDEQADALVRHAVRDIMVGVALSPYRAIDLFVVVYRSAAMIGGVMRVYTSRPHLRELTRTFRDTLRIVATVNYLNLGQKFIERLFSAVPFIGRFMDELAQGFGAGLLTSVAGHAAIQRCRAFREWDQEEAAQTIASKLGEFLTDVKEMFTRDVLPHIKRRAKARGEEKADEPGFWQKVKNAIEHSTDEVADWAAPAGEPQPAAATPEGSVPVPPEPDKPEA